MLSVVWLWLILPLPVIAPWHYSSFHIHFPPTNLDQFSPVVLPLLALWQYFDLHPEKNKNKGLGPLLWTAANLSMETLFYVYRELNITGARHLTVARHQAASHWTDAVWQNLSVKYVLDPYRLMPLQRKCCSFNRLILQLVCNILLLQSLSTNIQGYFYHTTGTDCILGVVGLLFTILKTISQLKGFVSPGNSPIMIRYIDTGKRGSYMVNIPRFQS